MTETDSKSREQKICILCGQPFTPRYKNSKCCTRPHYRTCEWCGKEFLIKDVHYPDRTCSAECRRQLRKKNAEATSLQKYGVKNAGGTAESKAKTNETCLAKYNVMWPGQAEIQKQHVKATFDRQGGNPMQRAECIEKAKLTNLEKYGDECVLGKGSSIRDEVRQRAFEKYGTVDPGNLPEFREKAKQTSLAHWGSEYYATSEEGSKKIQQTCLEKYGAVTPFGSKKIQEKVRKTMLEKYGTTTIMHIPGIMEKLMASNIAKYGVPFYCMHPDCLRALNTQPSALNKSFAKQLSDRVPNIGVEYEFHIPECRYSYDIHVLDTNALIEIDPAYTHTTAPTKLGNKAIDYHKKKSAAASKNGYRCIHVFDWDDWSKILNFFLPKQKIAARNCKVKEITLAEAEPLLIAYHLQGTCSGQSKCFGLYHDTELIQVMTFGKPRYNKQADWELIRYCTNPNFAVIGGAEKLFKLAVTVINPQLLVSYCDKSKFTGEVYKKLGFTLADEGSPSRHWCKGSKHITDNLLRQRGYDQLFGTNYGKGTSNEQLMLDNGWLPVCDCGQARFEWRSNVR